MKHQAITVIANTFGILQNAANYFDILSCFNFSLLLKST